ncbi:MAG: hypothetical protein GY941_15880, partial [Planctomycetes bacterium]|nr:hypothetical protein [Planctomycetota bacterium]
MKAYIILILFLFSGSIGAMTAEELRLLAGEAEQKQRQKDGRLDINDLDSFLPAVQQETIPAPEPEPEPQLESIQAPEPEPKLQQKPKSTKYQKSDIIKTSKPVPVIQKKTAFSSDVYIPPPRPGSTSKNSGSSDAVELKQRRFGIPLGTWVSAKLNR